MSLSNVTLGYDGQPAVVADMTVGLRPGALTVLLGPNAAGKTTLLRGILGQLPLRNGRVEMDGRSIHDMLPTERAARLSYVPQRGQASFAFSVSDVVAMGRHALTRDDAMVAAALRVCELVELRDSVYQELSVGQQQRVLLARAIAQTCDSDSKGIQEGVASRLPKAVMLLDEPVSAMDLRHAHHTLGLLRELTARGLTVLCVLHDLNIAARYADDVWLIHEGNLQIAGPWSDVLCKDMLDPVYGVDIRVVATSNDDRPIFDARVFEASTDLNAIAADQTAFDQTTQP